MSAIVVYESKSGRVVHYAHNSGAWLVRWSAESDLLACLTCGFAQTKCEHVELTMSVHEARMQGVA